MRIIGQIFAFWRNRHLSWTMLNWRQATIRADIRLEELQELDDAGDSDVSDYFCSHKDRLEDYTIPIRDWHYNKSRIMDDRATDAAYKSVENADNTEGHDLTLAMDIIADNIDVCSEPDTRAKFELSPTKHVVALENIGVNCITDGDVTVIGENVDGDTDAHEDEYIRVSMISVDEKRYIFMTHYGYGIA